MPEYRRFVAYFNEYIDGKKQGSAGFVKVELRNGLWRFFLRLTVGVCLTPPIRVYGFVREEGQLLGLPLGTIRPVQQIAEEWAFRDDAPVGEGAHRLEELSGIWIESGDGRRFVSVWDEEEIDAKRLVTEAEAEAAKMEEAAEEAEAAETEEAEAAKKEEAAEEAEATETEEVEEEPEVEEVKEELQEEEPEVEETEDEAVEFEAAQVELETDVSGMDVTEEGEVEEREEEEIEIEETKAEEIEKETAEEKGEAQEDAAEESEAQKDVSEESITEHGMAVVEELFQKRASFQPFPDGAIENCVMILPCDIVRLQQENWQVGRSSFLQHGFYQYRHLLLGRSGDGTYLLGVPGIDNPQEEYMAQMFGYEQFRRSARRDSDRNFGYWCRELRKI